MVHCIQLPFTTPQPPDACTILTWHFFNPESIDIFFLFLYEICFKYSLEVFHQGPRSSEYTQHVFLGPAVQN